VPSWRLFRRPDAADGSDVYSEMYSGAGAPVGRAADAPIGRAADAPVAGSRDSQLTSSLGVPFPIQVAAAWAWRFLVLAGATAVLLWLVVTFRLIVFPVVVALLLTALLYPLVLWTQRIGLGRGPAAAIVFVAGIAAIVLAFVLLAQVLAGAFGDISTSVQDGVARVREWLTTGPLGLSEAELQNYVDRVRMSIEANRDRLTTGAISTATAAVEFAAGAALVLFTTFFLLFDGHRVWAWVVRLFPRAVEARVDEAGQRAWVTLVAFVRGTIIVALVDGVATAVWLLILRVPLAVPLGVLVFFGAFVPLLGATLTGVVAVLVALVTKGLVSALLVLAGVIAIQQLEGHVLQPLVLGRLVRVHALAVVLAVTGGAVVAGVAGALIAVPLVAVVNTVTTYFVRGDGDIAQAAQDTVTVQEQERPAEAGEPRRSGGRSGG
jgi:predicted PurR-regulated permease PerM